MQGLLAFQQGLQSLGQQDRPEGVHGEAALQAAAPQPRQPFLRLKIALVQQAGGVDHQAQRRQPRQLPRQGLQAAVVGEIQLHGHGSTGQQRRAARAVAAHHGESGCPQLQSREQRSADAATSHHQRRAPPLIQGLWPGWDGG